MRWCQPRGTAATVEDLIASLFEVSASDRIDHLGKEYGLSAGGESMCAYIWCPGHNQRRGEFGNIVLNNPHIENFYEP